MPVSNTNTYTVSTANGVTTVFPYDFTLLNASDLVVTVAGVVVTTGFTVSGVGDAAGGNITFSVAPANGALVLRERVVAFTRSTDYQYVGSLASAVLDADFDQLWLAMQQVHMESSRAIKLPLGSTADPVLGALVAGRYLRVNATGDGFDQVAGFETAGVVVITPYAETIAACGDVASAQTVLGISVFGGTLVDDADAPAARATLGIDAALVKSLLPAGSVLNSVYAESTTYTSSSAAIPVDDTIPQNTEGVEILTGTITPSSTSSRIRVLVTIPATSPSNECITVALFRDSVANALCAVAGSEGVSPGPEAISLAYEYVPASVSSISLKVRVGTSGGSPFGVNGSSAGRMYGGVSRATMIIEEIKG